MTRDTSIQLQKDIEWYIFLCKKYEEKPVEDEYGINPYCEHSEELQSRLIEESI